MHRPASRVLFIVGRARSYSYFPYVSCYQACQRSCARRCVYGSVIRLADVRKGCSKYFRINCAGPVGSIGYVIIIATIPVTDRCAGNGHGFTRPSIFIRKDKITAAYAVA